MPDYKFKTCIIDGQEQYAVSPADCKDRLPEIRCIQFPESLLSFVDIEMHTIAPLFTEMSDGIRGLSDEHRSREYKRRFAWINAGKISKDDFYAWSKLAREKKKECDSGTIPCKSFFAWLRQS